MSKTQEMISNSVTMSDDIIDNMSSNQIKKELEKINVFSTVINKTLVSGTDYATIPHTSSKPTLLKSGAEKIFTLLRLVSKYEIISKVEDYDKGFFAYKIKCTLYNSSGQIKTEGLGAANTRESRYIRQDAFTLQNTVLKMAKKRAQVDAALTVSALSSMFTQDLDDVQSASNVNKPKVVKATSATTLKATNMQIKKILDLAQQIGKAKEIDSKKVFKNYNVSKPEALNKAQADRFIKKLETDFEVINEDHAIKKEAVEKSSEVGNTSEKRKTTAPNPDQINLDIENLPF